MAPEAKSRYGDQIQFIAGIGNAIVTAEMFERRFADFQREAGELFLAGHSNTRSGASPTITGSVASNSPTMKATR